MKACNGETNFAVPLSPHPSSARRIASRVLRQAPMSSTLRAAPTFKEAPFNAFATHPTPPFTRLLIGGISRPTNWTKELTLETRINSFAT
ncbi:hypothetical protein R5R35_003937 [Gryllus longicercus]|uniref:Uncharacterized protein n=1 Tax=Gryllus longicercus TaxID=2509291 RepID=A0AAN9VLZ3_9ORTH